MATRAFTRHSRVNRLGSTSPSFTAAVLLPFLAIATMPSERTKVLSRQSVDPESLSRVPESLSSVFAVICVRPPELPLYDVLSRSVTSIAQSPRLPSYRCLPTVMTRITTKRDGKAWQAINGILLPFDECPRDGRPQAIHQFDRHRGAQPKSLSTLLVSSSGNHTIWPIKTARKPGSKARLNQRGVYPKRNNTLGVNRRAASWLRSARHRSSRLLAVLGRRCMTYVARCECPGYVRSDGRRDLTARGLARAGAPVPG